MQKKYTHVKYVTGKTKKNVTHTCTFFFLLQFCSIRIGSFVTTVFPGDEWNLLFRELAEKIRVGGRAGRLPEASAVNESNLEGKRCSDRSCTTVLQKSRGQIRFAADGFDADQQQARSRALSRTNFWHEPFDS